MGQKQKKSKGYRKNKVFSVSLEEKELDQVDSFLKEQKEATGFNMSRNEFMRRCALAHILVSKTECKDYEAAFKSLAQG